MEKRAGICLRESVNRVLGLASTKSHVFGYTLGDISGGTMETTKVEHVVTALLNDFYTARINALNAITLSEVCKNAHYLHYAPVEKPAYCFLERLILFKEITSDRQLFTSIFLKPLIAAVHQADNGKTLLAKGENMEVITGYWYRIATYKFNGAIDTSLAGQNFWQSVTGDGEFYRKIYNAIGTLPSEHSRQYRQERDCLCNRLSLDFSLNFCYDGVLDWNRIFHAYDQETFVPVTITFEDYLP